ncbi:XkdX family protein [Ligilactobacillus araffinosus]|nr:XkdX family protein [Ligilactobacillus araffinosus]
MYEMIKSFYEQGYYTEQDLDLFVSVQWITEEQKEEIMKTK